MLIHHSTPVRRAWRGVTLFSDLTALEQITLPLSGLKLLYFVHGFVNPELESSQPGSSHWGSAMGCDHLKVLESG